MDKAIKSIFFLLKQSILIGVGEDVLRLLDSFTKLFTGDELPEMNDFVPDLLLKPFFLPLI